MASPCEAGGRTSATYVYVMFMLLLLILIMFMLRMFVYVHVMSHYSVCFFVIVFFLWIFLSELPEDGYHVKAVVAEVVAQ